MPLFHRPWGSRSLWHECWTPFGRNVVSLICFQGKTKAKRSCCPQWDMVSDHVKPLIASNNGSGRAHDPSQDGRRGMVETRFPPVPLFLRDVSLAEYVQNVSLCFTVALGWNITKTWVLSCFASIVQTRSTKVWREHKKSGNMFEAKWRYYRIWMCLCLFPSFCLTHCCFV